jgi:hypothetical protein
MITKNIDYFKKTTNRQLIVSRFINEKGEMEEGQAMVSSGSFNDYFYQSIHKKNTIKKELGDSEESFLSEDIFMNKVPFSFENEKVLVLTCLYSFSAYSDGSLIETPYSLGIEDSFFQEKSFKDVKTLDMDLNQYLNDLTPSKFKRESSEEETDDNPPCSSLTYELDIPIFGIKNSKEIQFAEGSIGIYFTFSQEPSKNQTRSKCEYLCWPGDSESFIRREDGQIDYSRYVLCGGGGGGGEINCNPPEEYKGPEVNFYGIFEVDFGPNA